MKALYRNGITKALGLQFPDQAQNLRRKHRAVGTQMKIRRFFGSGGFLNERWK